VTLPAGVTAIPRFAGVRHTPVHARRRAGARPVTTRWLRLRSSRLPRALPGRHFHALLVVLLQRFSRVVRQTGLYGDECEEREKEGKAAAR
jgi:hypothetical protein